MKFVVVSAALIGILTLSACGFQPVYGPQSAAASGNITVQQIDGRTGHALRRELLIELASGLPGADLGGELAVDLSETIIGQGFRTDGSATRSSVRLRARYVADVSTTAISGVQTAETVFSIPQDPFSEISVQTDAAERAAKELARRIVEDLILQLDAGE